MIFQKCVKCGGFVFKKDALKCECSKCGETYDLEYMQSHEEKTNFERKYALDIKDLFNSNNSVEIVKVIDMFLNSLASSKIDDLFYASAEIEHILLRIAYADMAESGEEFSDNPYNENVVISFGDSINKCRDIFYYIGEKTHGKIDYKWMMAGLSNQVSLYVTKALNLAAAEWNSYSKLENEYGWKSYINVLLYCTVLLDFLEKYGDVCLDSYYEILINIQQIAINLTYTHNYYVGSYKATQNIGLTDSSKSEWQGRLNKYKEKLKYLNDFKLDCCNRREVIRKKEIEEEKNRRRILFWDTHQEYKQSLLDEKEKNNSNIEILKKSMPILEENEAYNSLRNDLQIAKSMLSSLGLFALKEKKMTKIKIDNIVSDIDKIKLQIADEIKKNQTEIDTLNARNSEIDQEFKKDR